MKKLVLTLLLGAAPLCAQNPQIPVTGTVGAGGNFPAICTSTVTFPSDANYTPSYPAMACSSGVMIVRSSVSLTASRNLVLPVTQGFNWKIENLTSGSQSIQVIGPSGTGVAITNGNATVVLADGTNYVSAGGGGGGSITLTTNNTNGIAALSGSALNIPHYVGVASALTAGHCPEMASNGIDLVDSGAVCGSGSGGVTSFAAPSGSWPTWLVPTVTNATSTPSLAVAASAIPNSALANPSTSVDGQTCTLGSTCVLPRTAISFQQLAICSGAQAFSTAWSVYDNNAPTTGCYATAATTEAYFAFANSPSAPQYLQNSSLTLPPYFTQTNVTIYYTTTVTTGTIEFEMQSACPGSGYSPASPTWSTAATQTVTVPGTAGQTGTATFSAIAAAGANGCPSASSSGAPLYLRIFRGTSDTAAASANAYAALITNQESQ